MKKNILFGFLFCLSAIALMSNSGGIGAAQKIDRTGANNSTCAACHATGSYNLTSELRFLDNGVAITQYIPGKTYTAELEIKQISGKKPLFYGFQLVALKGLATNENAGDLKANVAKDTVHVLTIAGKKYVEHDAAKKNGKFYFQWVAPVAATGKVTFFASGVGADGQNGFNGDNVIVKKVELQEGKSNAANEANTFFQAINIAPNPSTTNVSLTFESNINENAMIDLYDLAGKKIQSAAYTIQTGRNNILLHTDNLEQGIYLVKLKTKNSFFTKKFVLI